MSEDGAEFTCQLTSVEDCTEINATLPVDFKLECPASLPTRAATAETELLAAMAKAEADARAEAEAKAQAEADAKAKANEKHIVLPGWEDVIVGRSPPADARQKCTKDPDEFWTRCRGCRSAKLPTPCIEIFVKDSDPYKVSMINVVLPELETDARRVIADLKKAWGATTTSKRDPILDVDCWDGRHEYIWLQTSYYDMSNVTIASFRDPKARVPRAQHPRRVLIIAEPLAGGSCPR